MKKFKQSKKEKMTCLRENRKKEEHGKLKYK